MPQIPFEITCTPKQERPTTFPQEEVNPDYEFVLLPDGTYAVHKYLNTTAEEATIPQKFNEKAVTRILSSAFQNVTTLKSIVVPNSITTIDLASFSGCSNLESLTLPFIGETIKTRSDDYQYPLGFIFGTTEYSGSVKTSQLYRQKVYERVVDFYVPASLKTLTITGGTYCLVHCIHAPC